MSINKRTTKTINRQTRHVLKRESGKLAEREKKSKNDLPASFKPARRAKKKGSIKYEEIPVSREAKIDQKVKNWKLKKILEQSHTCQKCGGWTGDSCHCKCVREASNQALIKEFNRRLKNRELNFELEPVTKKKVSSKK